MINLNDYLFVTKLYMFFDISKQNYNYFFDDYKI